MEMLKGFAHHVYNSFKTVSLAMLVVFTFDISIFDSNLKATSGGLVLYILVMVLVLEFINHIDEKYVEKVRKEKQ